MTAPNIIGAYMDRQTERAIADACRRATEGQDIPGDLMVPINADAIRRDKTVYRPSVAVWVVVAVTWPAIAWGVAWTIREGAAIWQ